MQINISVPYDDFVELGKDSAQKKAIVDIINTDFPDDTCQLVAIKAVLGIVEKEEPTDPVDPPSDPTP